MSWCELSPVTDEDNVGINGGNPNGLVAVATAGEELRLVDELKGFIAPEKKNENQNKY